MANAAEVKAFPVKIIIKDTGECVLRERTVNAQGALIAANAIARSYFGGEPEVEYWGDGGNTLKYVCDADNELLIVVGKVSNWHRH